MYMYYSYVDRRRPPLEVVRFLQQQPKQTEISLVPRRDTRYVVTSQSDVLDRDTYNEA